MEKITIIKEWNLFGSSLTVSQTTQPVKLYSPSDVLERSGGVLISSSGSSGHDAAGCGSGHQVRLGSFRDAGNLLVLYKVSRTNLATICSRLSYSLKLYIANIGALKNPFPSRS